MMDDLISRKAAIKALSHGEGCGHVCRNAIKRIPSVEAVPLEPLCQWLAKNASWYVVDNEGQPDNWKEILIKWIEESSIQ